MTESNRNASRFRPPTLKLSGAPECDEESGDHIFRFALEAPRDVPQGDLFRWVVEEQLRALLELVELSDGAEERVLTHYRFRNEGTFRKLYPAEDADA